MPERSWPEIVHHRHLLPSHTATTARLDGGEPLITDGPFVEGRTGRSRASRTGPTHGCTRSRGGAGWTCCAARRATATSSRSYRGRPDRSPTTGCGDHEAIGYHLFHATRAELLRDLGRPGLARAADERALLLTANPAEQSLLRQRLSWA